MDEIVIETMKDYNNYLDNLKIYILPLAENFRDGKLNKAIKEVSLLFEGIEWIMTINMKLRELNYINKLDSTRLNNLLNELADAFENKDYNLCADILEYEILTVVNELEAFKLREN